MNPWLILGAVVMWGASVVGAYFYGGNVGANAEIAKQASIKEAVEATRKAAQEGAANEIAKLKIRHTTVKGKVETIVRENVVYRDCKHSPDSLRLINDALGGRAGTTGEGNVPRADPPDR